jgi:DNA-binding CsgD family transcriptional regulator
MRQECMLELAGIYPTGCILADSDGQIVRANSRAESLLAEDGPLGIQNGRLIAGSLTSDLLSLISRAAETLNGPSVMSIPRPSGRPIVIRAMPYEDTAQNGGRVVLLISDLADRPKVDRRVLKALFRFTDTEAEIAEILMRGLNLDQIADELEIMVNTVRAHLKKLFEKTGTTRQAELLGLLLRTPAHIQEMTISLKPAVSPGSTPQV